ncbi:MAG: fructosamine kinase family protein [Ignavibacteria bacterium]|nr:fructosamine kinase family protein [Ignavibacteria bacterium]
MKCEIFLPEEIKGEVKQILPLGGGCIADVKKIIMQDGRKILYKIYSRTIISETEANGLKEISKSGAIRVPKVIYSNKNILITEFIESGSKIKNTYSDFGKNFAKMHKYYSEYFGFYEDNFIGETPQKNLPKNSSWTEFYFTNRLLFQIKLAEKNGYLSKELKNSFEKLERRIDSIILDEGQASLLHGDLWSGNYIVDENGNACLIDPAVYYGNREADLAMTKLFGGFPPEFYHAYNQEYPLQEGYLFRENIYKLYHILNHLNLFGYGYYSQALGIIKSYI